MSKKIDFVQFNGDYGVRAPFREYRGSEHGFTGNQGQSTTHRSGGQSPNLTYLFPGRNKKRPPSRAAFSGLKQYLLKYSLRPYFCRVVAVNILITLNIRSSVN